MADKLENSKEQRKADLANERELTRLQRIYRNYANNKYALKEDKNQRKNVIKTLEQLKQERRDVKANLTVATGITHWEETELHMACLATHVQAQETVQESIEASRMQIVHLTSQMKELAAQRFELSKTALTDLQYNQNLLKAAHTLETLEKRLDVSRKQECVQVARNSRLRDCVEHMLHDRASFNRMWQQAIAQLTFDKKFLIDMVDRAVLAFNQRAELCTELDRLRELSLRDKRQHIVEILDMLRRLDADNKGHSFLRSKDFKRELFEIEPREMKRRQLVRNDQRQKTNFYKSIINKMIECSDVRDIHAAIEKFIKVDDEFFAHFNYMNHLNYQFEFLNECLRKTYHEIDAQREYNTKKEAYQIKMLTDIQKPRKNNQTERDVRSSAQLRQYFGKIEEIFETLRCDRTTLDERLGDQTHVTKHNLLEYLAIIEARLNTVLSYVYSAERQRIQKIGGGTVRGIERSVKCDPTPIEDVVLVQQCAECAEGEVNRYDEEIVYPLEMPEIRVKVRAKTVAPELQYRLHRLSQCRLPRSRALVNKRYQ